MAWPSSSPLREPPVAVPALSPAVARLVLGVSAVLLGWVGFRFMPASAPGLSGCWALDGLYLVALALAAAAPTGRSRPSAAGNAAVCTGGFLVGGLLSGTAGGQLVAMAAANLAVAAVAVWAHQLGTERRSWVPRDAPEAVWLMLVIAPAAAVGALLGAYPGSGLATPHSGEQILWAAVRQFSVLAITVNCVLPLLFRRDPSDGDRLPVRGPRARTVLGHLPGYLIGVAACLTLPHLLPHQPLSWLFIALAAWTGLLFGIRGTAVLAFAITIAFIATAYRDVAPPVAGVAAISPQLLADFTPAFVTHVALMLAVFRENLVALRAEVAARAAAEQDRREILDGIVQTLSHGLLLTRPDGRVTLSNRAAEHLVGDVPDRVSTEWIRQVELQATDVRRVVAATEHPASEQPASEHPASEPQASEHPAAGHRRPLRLSVTSQDLVMGGQRLNLLLLRDVTAAHDRQQQLETFAGTVAHDLKTPLSALTGWMEAAAEEFVGDDTDTGLMLLHRAQAAVFRMQKLIDDYLAFAVSRGGAMTVVDVPLAAIVSDVVAGYDARGLAAASGPYFAVDVPHVVRADEALTRQLVGNLVGNAVKYARPGRPAHIDIRSAEVEPGWIEVAVADRGRGLDPGDEERIFTAFSRSTKDAADVEGIGLGLSLCHAIVTRHGGRIGAATNTWGGATFRFTLPAGTAP